MAMARPRGPKRSKRGEAPTSLGDLVRRTAPGKAAAEISVSRAVWQAVAGVGFARRTRPDRVHRGTLYVIVSSAGWAQELALVEKVVVDRLRERGVAVERLRYTVGEVEAFDRGGVYAPKPAVIERARNMDVPVEAARAIAKVRDPALRETIAKAARAAARRIAEVDAKESAKHPARPMTRVPGEGKR